MSDTVTCENVKPMAKWLQETEVDPKVCKPCAVALLTGDYKEVLADAGHEDKVAMLDALLVPVEGQDIAMNVAVAMDRVKAEVEEPVREQLLELDCMAQNSEAEE